MKQSNQELNKRVTKLAPETMQCLQNYHWPGNVRELQSVVRYAVVHTIGDVITPECLPEACRGLVPAGNGSAKQAAAPLEDLTELAHFVRRLLRSQRPDVYRHVLAEVDRVTFREALQHVGGNQVHASQRLGVSRTTLRNKLANLEADQGEHP